MFTIKNQEEFNECLMWISDLSKEACGFRARGRDWDKMSFEELAAEVNYYSDIVKREEEVEESGYEYGIRVAMESGAPDRETAERWLEDSEWD
jgi:hypothetical protein